MTDGAGGQLVAFNVTDGIDAVAPVTLATDGNYYGTTAFGGSAGLGVLFKVTTAGSLTVLHSFAGGADGSFPDAAPIEASDGNLYGTTHGDPATIYKYTRSGVFSTIYQADDAHGQPIVAPLLQAADGNFYGVGQAGGTNKCGTIFKITREGHVLQTYSFTCGKGGSSPSASLIQASDGNFYGTTASGGTAALGTVFKMNQSGAVSILYSFQGTPDGDIPAAPLVEGTDGNLYGTSELGGTNNIGTLFQISPGGAYKQLYSFQSGTGQFPAATLLQHTSGAFYGTAVQGGANNFGAVFKLDMGLGPFVAFVRPTGKVGQTAQILGQGLTGSTSVTFNGVPASSFSVVSDTYMTAVVPSGASTGPVVVTTPSGPLTSNVSFRISQ
jgi:uncharacterized repeat protein (TIGR03803 family)